ncbi:MAG: hypothetical protein ACRDID_21200 [Ktedonobacterales bacterium]
MPFVVQGQNLAAQRLCAGGLALLIYAGEFEQQRIYLWVWRQLAIRRWQSITQKSVVCRVNTAPAGVTQQALMIGDGLACVIGLLRLRQHGQHGFGLVGQERVDVSLEKDARGAPIWGLDPFDDLGLKVRNVLLCQGDALAAERIRDRRKRTPPLGDLLFGWVSH